MGTVRGTTKARGQKHDLDKFYTKPSVAAQCLGHLDLSAFGRIIEPSAGSGAFSNILSAAGLPLVALDLDPEDPSITKQDWFSYQVTSSAKTLVVGNPPFGKQGSLAVRFINHAFEVVGADTVAFILPRGFRKASTQRRIFKFATLESDILLDPNSFLLEGVDYDLPCVFQVWKRSPSARSDTPGPTTSTNFTFTKKSEKHDFAVRRVGGKAGHAFIDDASTSEQSNYFVKLGSGSDVGRVISMINGLDFSVADDGTGPRTLSKRELVALVDAGFASLPKRRTSSRSRKAP